jgi:uncharacterized damage-inducible protein DinB
MSLSDLLLAEFDQELEVSRAMLSRYPEGQGGWKPHEKSMSLSRLATHVAEIPQWVEAILVKDEFDLNGPEMQEWVPREMQTREELLEEMETAAARFREVVSGMTDEDFQKIWTMRAGDQVTMSGPKYLVFRRQVMDHLVHHRAQLGVFYRMLDVPLPGSYGPTADEGM